MYFPSLSAGKSVVLVLKAVRWLLAGWDVHVLSWRVGARAASLLACLMVEASLRGHPTSPRGALHPHLGLDLARQDGVDSLVADLTAAAAQAPILVIIDEADFGNRFV